MRVGDAERAEIADLLARHYSDGRLDRTEFDQRLDQAMRAKTRADLVAALADLPDEPPRAGQPAQQVRQTPPTRPPRRRTLSPLPGIILVVVLALLLARHGPWLLIAVLGCVWLLFRRHRRA
jgi:Domain of unknown function (DUF1707)